MKYKKIISILLCVAFFITPLICSAVNSASIGGNDIVADGSLQMVPIYLSDNPGIMGYKVSIEYPKGVEIKSISRGTLCQSGNFNTSLENHSENKIDIVWNNTENISEDGSLFIVSLKAGKETINKELKISYSKDDTFNEEWQDVALFCTGMSFVETESSQTVISKDSISDRDYEYIKTVIENELENSGVATIEELDENNSQAVLKKIKEEFPGLNINNIEDVKKIYIDSIKNGLISTVVTATDLTETRNYIKESLDEVNAKGFDDIDGASLSAFNKSVAEKINSNNSQVINDDFTKLNEKDKLEVIESIYENANVEETSENLFVYVIIGVIGAVILAIISIIIIHKKRSRGNDKKDNVDCVDIDNNI